MARRNRYKKMEDLMTKVLLGDTLAFVLFLFFSSRDWTVVKIVAAVLVLLVSVLSLVWLFITSEFFRRRSLWMVTGFSAIVLCVIVSLILKYPCLGIVG